jgi:hypothetical protein
MTPTDARAQYDDMLTLLEAQAKLARQLSRLAETQRSCVTAEDTAPLMSVLARRKEVTDELSRLSGRLATAREQWPAVKRLLPDEAQQRVSALREEVHAAVKAVLANDAEDASRLRLKRDQVLDGLKTTQQGKALVQAYGPATSVDSECLDTTHDDA